MCAEPEEIQDLLRDLHGEIPVAHGQAGRQDSKLSHLFLMYVDPEDKSWTAVMVYDRQAMSYFAGKACIIAGGYEWLYNPGLVGNPT